MSSTSILIGLVKSSVDNSNNALSWYEGMMDTLLGSSEYSYWEIGDELPYSATDVTANLNYFNTVVWYAAYNNTASANDTYNRAEASLVNFIMGGGNLFINPIDFEDTTFTWFPLGLSHSFLLESFGHLGFLRDSGTAILANP